MHTPFARFVIEGNIGAGKSTFLTMLKKHLNIPVIYEPHQKWQRIGDTDHNLLDAFYQEPQRWAYTLQSYAFITRIIAQEEFASSSQNSCAILERSVFSDRYCFAKNGFEMGVMNALEWNVYQEWFSWLVERHVVMPHGFIYLRTDPEICYQRLLKRARSEEAAVPYDYLKKLHDKHEAWLINKEEIAPYAQAIPVLVLNCNNDFEYNEQEQYNHVEKIQGFITETSGLVFPVTTQQRMTL